MAENRLEWLKGLVAQRPDDLDVRTSYAAALLEAGDATGALGEATHVLHRGPDHLQALGVAAAAARRTGNAERAIAYERLLTALGADPAPQAVPDTAGDLIKMWASSPAATDPNIGELEHPAVTLTDVGGMETVKRRLEASFFGPLRNPELRQAFGKDLRGGLLLYGPPGCGKTFLAKAVAGELGACFYAVGLADVLDMWVGSSERNLHDIFEAARANRPCVLFLDELDALGMKRGQARGTHMRGVVNQLLMELDGVDSANDDVFVLGATNHPWDIDAAIMRPGRLDRTLLVNPPDRRAREAILGLHLAGKPTNGIDIPRLAGLTGGLSGADLALICETATEEALAASVQSGRLEPITQAQLEVAAIDSKPCAQTWFGMARNHVLFGNEDGRFDELATYMESPDS